MTEISELSRSIIEFLRAASAPKITHCDGCGALMECVPVTVHFAGEVWDIAMPVCRLCDLDSTELIEHRPVA